MDRWVQAGIGPDSNDRERVERDFNGRGPRDQVRIDLSSNGPDQVGRDSRSEGRRDRVRIGLGSNGQGRADLVFSGQGQQKMRVRTGLDSSDRNRDLADLSGRGRRGTGHTIRLLVVRVLVLAVLGARESLIRETLSDERPVRRACGAV